MRSFLVTSSEISRRMSKVRQKNTGSELAIRKELHRLGLRYRVNLKVLGSPRRIADIAFSRLRVAVFVDGCFWHGCPVHARYPKNNYDYWREKIDMNRDRDADTNMRLRELGWEVVRVWSHELPENAAQRVMMVVLSKRRERQIL